MNPLRNGLVLDWTPHKAGAQILISHDFKTFLPHYMVRLFVSFKYLIIVMVISFWKLLISPMECALALIENPSAYEL